MSYPGNKDCMVDQQPLDVLMAKPVDLNQTYSQLPECTIGNSNHELDKIDKLPNNISLISGQFDNVNAYQSTGVCFPSEHSSVCDITLPLITIKPCSFHQCLAVYKRIQLLGLSKVYFSNPTARRIISSLMHLSFLPEDDIVSAFRELRVKCVGRSFSHKVSQLLIELFDYFFLTWIKGDLFEISDCCMFRERHRTKNICEEYHSYLVRVQLKAKMNVYSLIYKLFQESPDLPGQMDNFCHDTHISENSIMVGPYHNVKHLEFKQAIKKRASSNPFESPHVLISNMYKHATSDRQFIEGLGLGTRCVLWKNLTQVIYRQRAKKRLPTIHNMFDLMDFRNLPDFDPKLILVILVQGE